MKIDQIPDIYIEQYLLDELPANLRKEMDALISENPSLGIIIEAVKKSNESILSAYPVEYITTAVLDRVNKEKAASESGEKADRTIAHPPAQLLKNFINKFRTVAAKRYTLTFSSAAVIAFVIFYMIPGTLITGKINIGYDTDVRIKGLESKLIIYRMRGKEVEELKNSDSARKGDIIQLGYIATEKFKYGTIISIDGRGAITLHYPENPASQTELIMNKKILLNKSYELDDSPSFERFIMIFSSEPVNTAGLIKKAKKLAMSRESSLNESIGTENNSVEFSVVIKKIE